MSPFVKFKNARIASVAFILGPVELIPWTTAGMHRNFLECPKRPYMASQSRPRVQYVVPPNAAPESCFGNKNQCHIIQSSSSTMGNLRSIQVGRGCAIYLGLYGLCWYCSWPLQWCTIEVPWLYNKCTHCTFDNNDPMLATPAMGNTDGCCKYPVQ